MSRYVPLSLSYRPMTGMHRAENETEREDMLRCVYWSVERLSPGQRPGTIGSSFRCPIPSSLRPLRRRRAPSTKPPCSSCILSSRDPATSKDSIYLGILNQLRVVLQVLSATRPITSCMNCFAPFPSTSKRKRAPHLTDTAPDRREDN